MPPYTVQTATLSTTAQQHHLLTTVCCKYGMALTHNQKQLCHFFFCLSLSIFNVVILTSSTAWHDLLDEQEASIACRKDPQRCCAVHQVRFHAAVAVPCLNGWCLLHPPCLSTAPNRTQHQQSRNCCPMTVCATLCRPQNHCGHQQQIVGTRSSSGGGQQPALVSETDRQRSSVDSSSLGPAEDAPDAQLAPAPIVTQVCVSAHIHPLRVRQP